MKKKWHLKRKYKFLIFMVLALAFTLLWSRYISTSGLVVKEYKVVNSNLPISFEGLKIVHFTDVHYGRTVKNAELEHLVNEINSLKPDLIFFTGDLIDKERQLELAYQAERSFDVFRNGKPLVRRYPGPQNQTVDIQASDFRVVYYIPQSAINSYPGKLTQNPTQ